METAGDELTERGGDPRTMRSNEMGKVTDARVAIWQKKAGIEPATGDRAELLEEMSQAAFELIKVVELELSGIRDGDGHWYGDVWGGMTRDFVKLFKRWNGEQ
jgi:hypothetical protein